MWSPHLAFEFMASSGLEIRTNGIKVNTRQEIVAQIGYVSLRVKTSSGRICCDGPMECVTATRCYIHCVITAMSTKAIRLDPAFPFRPGLVHRTLLLIFGTTQQLVTHTCLHA